MTIVNKEEQEHWSKAYGERKRQYDKPNQILYNAFFKANDFQVDKYEKRIEMKMKFLNKLQAMRLETNESKRKQVN